MGLREDLDKYKAQANRAEVIALQSKQIIEEQRKEIQRLTTYLVSELDSLKETEKKVSIATNTLRNRTKINVRASGHPSCDNQIIVTGTYHCSDYVEIFNIPGDRMDHLMHQLRSMRSAGVINKIDAPKEMTGIMKHELRYSND